MSTTVIPRPPMDPSGQAHQQDQRGRRARRDQRGHRARRDQREAGVAVLELVGILPVALLAIAVVVQLTLGVHAIQSANDAARQAARAYSLDRSPTQAAQDTLPGGIRLVGSVQTFGPRHGARVTVEVPRITRLLPQWQVSRDAVMP